MNENMDFSSWFVKIFCDQELIVELLIDCPVNDMKYIVCGLLKTAMLKVGMLDCSLSYKAFT